MVRLTPCDQADAEEMVKVVPTMKSTLGTGAARRGPICRLAVSRTVCALALFALSSSCNPAVEVEDDGAGWAKRSPLTRRTAAARNLAL